jgi:DNA repair protein RadC
MKRDYKPMNLYRTIKEPNTADYTLKVTTSKDAFQYCSQLYGEDFEIVETFYILFLNAGNKIKGASMISKGGMTSTVVDVRIIGKQLLDTLSNGCVLCHNHPSGNLTPSEADKVLTQKIKEMCKIIDVKLLDHIILGGSSYFSFADEGIL